MDDFYSQTKTRKDGSTYIYYPPYCKECTGNKYRQWVKDNRDKKRARDREWVKKPENVPKVRKNQKLFIERGKRKEWIELNRDKMKQYQMDRMQNKSHDISDAEWMMCKEYFGNSCAYCGLPLGEHIKKYRQDLHREHVDSNGSNKLDNCIPSCKKCNSSKFTFEFEEWYNSHNPVFNTERYIRINNWLTDDYKTFIISP